IRSSMRRASSLSLILSVSCAAAMSRAAISFSTAATLSLSCWVMDARCATSRARAASTSSLTVSRDGLARRTASRSRACASGPLLASSAADSCARCDLARDCS
ncbi:hypothetical protein Vafri_15282, partial [Volvox africanus]